MPVGARPEVNRRIRALNVNAARAIFNGWVSRQPKVHAAWTDQKPRFDTWKESFERWDKWIAETEPDEFWMRRFNNPKRAGAYTSGVMGDEYELIVAAHREIFDGRSARNSKAVGEHYAGIISGLKAHEGPPGIKLRFLQPCNEPNNPDYTGQFRADHDDPDSPIDMAAAVDAGWDGNVESVSLRYAAWKDELSNCEHGKQPLPANRLLENRSHQRRGEI